MQNEAVPQATLAQLIYLHATRPIPLEHRALAAPQMTDRSPEGQGAGSASPSWRNVSDVISTLKKEPNLFYRNVGAFTLSRENNSVAGGSFIDNGTFTNRPTSRSLGNNGTSFRRSSMRNGGSFIEGAKARGSSLLGGGAQYSNSYNRAASIRYNRSAPSLFVPHRRNEGWGYSLGFGWGQSAPLGGLTTVQSTVPPALQSGTTKGVTQERTFCFSFDNSSPSASTSGQEKVGNSPTAPPITQLSITVAQPQPSALVARGPRVPTPPPSHPRTLMGRPQTHLRPHADQDGGSDVTDPEAIQDERTDISTVDGQRIVRLDQAKGEYAYDRRKVLHAPRPAIEVYPAGDQSSTSEFYHHVYTPWWGEVWDAMDKEVEEQQLEKSRSFGGYLSSSNFSSTFGSAIFRSRAAAKSTNRRHLVSGVKGTSADPAFSTLAPAEMRYRECRHQLQDARRSRRKMAALVPSAIATFVAKAQDDRRIALAKAEEAKSLPTVPARPALALGGPNDPTDLCHIMRQVGDQAIPALADADPSDFSSYYRRQRVEGKRTALVVAAELLARDQRQRKDLQNELFSRLQGEQLSYIQTKEAKAAMNASVNSQASSKATIKGKQQHRPAERVLFDLNGVHTALLAHQRENLSNGPGILSSATAQQAVAASSGDAHGRGKGEGERIEGKNYLLDGPSVFGGGQCTDIHTITPTTCQAFEDEEISRLLFNSGRALVGGSKPSLVNDLPQSLANAEILFFDTTPQLTGTEKTLCSQLSQLKYKLLMGGKRYATLALESGAAAEEAERELALAAFERRKKRRGRGGGDSDSFSNSSSDSLLEGFSRREDTTESDSPKSPIGIVGSPLHHLTPQPPTAPSNHNNGHYATQRTDSFESLLDELCIEDSEVEDDLLRIDSDSEGSQGMYSGSTPPASSTRSSRVSRAPHFLSLETIIEERRIGGLANATRLAAKAGSPQSPSEGSSTEAFGSLTRNVGARLALRRFEEVWYPQYIPPILGQQATETGIPGSSQNRSRSPSTSQRRSQVSPAGNPLAVPTGRPAALPSILQPVPATFQASHSGRRPETLRQKQVDATLRTYDGYAEQFLFPEKRRGFDAVDVQSLFKVEHKAVMFSGGRPLSLPPKKGATSQQSVRRHREAEETIAQLTVAYQRYCDLLCEQPFDACHIGAPMPPPFLTVYNPEATSSPGDSESEVGPRQPGKLSSLSRGCMVLIRPSKAGSATGTKTTVYSTKVAAKRLVVKAFLRSYRLWVQYRRQLSLGSSLRAAALVKNLPCDVPTEDSPVTRSRRVSGNSPKLLDGQLTIPIPSSVTSSSLTASGLTPTATGSMGKAHHLEQLIKYRAMLANRREDNSAGSPPLTPTRRKTGPRSPRTHHLSHVEAFLPEPFPGTFTFLGREAAKPWVTTGIGSTYPCLSLVALAELLTPGLFTSVEVLDHLCSEIAKAETEAEESVVPSGIASLEWLPLTGDGVSSFGGYAKPANCEQPFLLTVAEGSPSASSLARFSVRRTSSSNPFNTMNKRPSDLHLSSQGRKQLSRIYLLMNGLAERHLEFEQLTTSPPAAMLSSGLQTLQLLVASCTSGLPDPWSQHVTARHVGHWLGTRKFLFRSGKAKASIATQTTLQFDKDYRAMRTTLISFASSGEEPVARQRILHHEKSEFASFMLKHHLKRRMCEVPTFRMSTIATHRRLIEAATAEERKEDRRSFQIRDDLSDSNGLESFCAEVLLSCGSIHHFSRPPAEAKTHLLSYTVVKERNAREDLQQLCRAAYERIALQRHIDLQRILASCDTQEMDFQLHRGQIELQRLKKQNKRARSMLYMLEE